MADNRRKLCGHCDQSLLLPVYKQHRDRYYDVDAQAWSRVDDGIISSDEGSDCVDMSDPKAWSRQASDNDDSSCYADDVCSDLSQNGTTCTHTTYSYYITCCIKIYVIISPTLYYPSPFWFICICIVCTSCNLASF